ncbi:hypothetical protein [Brevibacillus massiliensis]|uniref:hypothetical protein n=1 Tax=Brevibacillus massiliensis TaxID=1118054 RepID=UPI0003757999|nr:hypothetical protein [Brevibacillus massiliensis]
MVQYKSSKGSIFLYVKPDKNAMLGLGSIVVTRNKAEILLFPGIFLRLHAAYIGFRRGQIPPNDKFKITEDDIHPSTIYVTFSNSKITLQQIPKNGKSATVSLELIEFFELLKFALVLGYKKHLTGFPETHVELQRIQIVFHKKTIWDKYLIFWVAVFLLSSAAFVFLLAQQAGML